MSQLCYTCSRTVEDAVAYRCTRPFCQAKKEAEKDAKLARGTRPVEPPMGDKWDDYVCLT